MPPLWVSAPIPSRIREPCGENFIAFDSKLTRICSILPASERTRQGKIEQILVNLLSNAMKFSPHGSRIRLGIGAETHKGGMRVAIEVCDQGPGVPEADRTRIFGAYEQTAEGRRVGGAGLGLAICAANVHALGGTIGVTDAQGGGSRFVLSFEVQPAEKAPEASPEDGVDVETWRPSLRILVAEDNAANQKVLAVLLRPLGLTPTFVGNGLEALEAVRAEAFDLILMDANMPVMDGATAARAIRALPQPVAHTPIHMVTANVFEEDRAGYLAAGADGVLAKPVVVAELYALIASCSKLHEPDTARRPAA